MFYIGAQCRTFLYNTNRVTQFPDDHYVKNAFPRRAVRQINAFATLMNARWPGNIKSRTMTKQVGHLVDFMPAWLALSGSTYLTKLKQVGGTIVLPTEGQSLLPVLRGEIREGRDYLGCACTAIMPSARELGAGWGRRRDGNCATWKLIGLGRRIKQISVRRSSSAGVDFGLSGASEWKCLVLAKPCAHMVTRTCGQRPHSPRA